MGEPTSIADLAGALRSRVHALPPDQGNRGLFASTYSRTTEAIGKAVADQFFDDNEWVEAWDLAFGGFFLRAFDAFLDDDLTRMSRPWRLAFSVSGDVGALRHVLVGVNAHVNYDLPQALLAVISDEEFDDPRVMERRRADYERVDGILAGAVAGEDKMLKSAGVQVLLDRVLTPLNRLASKRFLRESRHKVFYNAHQLHLARAEGRSSLEQRLGELEVLSAAKVAELVEPGQVLLKVAVSGFGVTLPPP